MSLFRVGLQQSLLVPTRTPFSHLPARSLISPLASIQRLHTSSRPRYSTLLTTQYLLYSRWNAPQKRNLTLQNPASQSMLAHMEYTANTNPNNAAAQNAFYKACLSQGLPQIVIERYNSGRYATNEAVEKTLLKAMESASTAPAQSASSFGGGASSGSLTDTQRNVVSQAIASRHTGSTMAVWPGASKPAAEGSKGNAVHVMIQESWGTTIYKWVRLAISVGLVLLAVFMVLGLYYETTSLLSRGVGGRREIQNEAKAQHQKARFSDVHGCDEAKEELQELVEFLKNPTKFSALGGKLPKGVLLVGPPGTGKTLLARAVAGEAGVPFFFMSGSEFDEIYVGVGAKRVRELFEKARAKAPSIIFIDELDAVGGKRNAKDSSYVKQTLNQLLTELDGFAKDSGVIIIGATNFPESLDKALTRPGRFDRNVAVPLPDVRGRMQILKHHLSKVKTAGDVDESIIARSTPGFSGADLENLVNQAAVRASRNKQERVTSKDFEWSKDRIMMGAERRSAVIQAKDRLMTAYHEGGHALVGLYTPGATPLYKATIMPRGMALGVTHFLPEMDQVSHSKEQLIATMTVCMGGKVAEELVYGPEKVTSGASSDISNATNIAYSMVTKYGFSSLGDVDLSSNRPISPMTRSAIDAEIKRLIGEAREEARKILTERREELDKLAKALVEYEVLDADEIRKAVKGEKIDKMSALMPSKDGGEPGDGKKRGPSIKLPEPVAASVGTAAGGSR